MRTECLVTYDAASIYVAFRAFDPRPAEIRAHLADRDAITTFQQDDHVGFLLDPFNDERRAFQFRVNPLGVQADAVFSELDGIEDLSWDAIWKSGRPHHGRRVRSWRSRSHSTSSASRGPRPPRPGVSTPSAPSRAASATGSPRTTRTATGAACSARPTRSPACRDDARASNLELDPTVTGHRTDRRADVSRGARSSSDGQRPTSGSARAGAMTPNLILNATVNPDFSQVEADVAQLDVNTRFALFFPEKRPFFLEGHRLLRHAAQTTVFTRTSRTPRAA